MNFVTTLLTTIDTEVNHYTFDAYHAVASSMYLTLTILLVIYFAGLGWMVIRGHIRLTPMAVAWHMLKACVIYILAIRWDYFSFYIANIFTHVPDRLLGSLLTNITPTSGGELNVNTITNLLAQLWQSGTNIFINVWQESGTTFWLGTAFGFLGYAAVTGLTAVPLFYIVMSKIALAVLLVLAPFFLPLFLWNSTRALFNGWLRLLIKWSLTPLFIYVFASLYINLLQAQINSMSNVQGMPTTASISVLVLLALIMIGTFLQAAKMATEIARGVKIHDLRVPKFEVTGHMIKAWREK